jgi:hypothetical protein
MTKIKAPAFVILTSAIYCLIVELYAKTLG